MMKEVMLKIAENRALNENVYQMILSGDTSAVTCPGQFVNIQINGVFLRRPLSVCDCEENRLTVVYKVTGKGTELLSQMEKGTVSVLTGLGNGFDLSLSGSRPLLIGGGLGFTPIYFLAKELVKKKIVPSVILGFGTKREIVYENEFRKLGVDLTITTADGSSGIKGFVTDVIGTMDYTRFYACGPEAMFNAINDTASGEGEFSFEARMGCGFGACMGCTCRTIAGNKRICKDGPVLKRGEILWPI